MEQEQLKKIRIWFDGYVASLYGDDEFVNVHLKLKEEHSRRTCGQILYLAQELGLTDEQRQIAEVTALLHDVGRFGQFVKYRTYNDTRSVNHCLLGLEVLQERKVLDEVVEQEKQLIEKAIEYHGLIELPVDLDGDCLLFSKFLRDADKLDIFYVITKCYKQYRNNPEEFKLGLEFPDRPECSAELVEDILRGRRIDNSRLRTLNDMKLMQLGWVYDVNFTVTLKRIKKRRFLEMIVDFLPKSRDIEKVEKKIFEYVDSAIEQNG